MSARDVKNDLSVDSDTEDPTDSDQEDVIHQENEPLEESIYGWAISTIIRDVVWLGRGTKLHKERTARIANSGLMVFLTICLQIFLLFAVSRLLCAPSVLNIRKEYGQYEALMYPNHTILTVNGFPRGVPGFLKEENFLLMSNETAKSVCGVPLSHPWYLSSILFIWTLTCQVELRAIFETFVRLLLNTPTVKSTSQILEEGEEDEVTVTGLTFLMKTVIGVGILLPRAVTLITLLYLGCRWLTSTMGLGDVLLNGLALEFMVVLKELLYNAAVSHRIRLDTQRLLVRPLRDVNKATFCTFFDSQIWGVLSIAWVLLYVYRIQSVLPDYRWDVHAMCEKFMPKGPLF